MADADPTELVTIRSDRGEGREVARVAVPFFTNQGFVVLKADGSVNPHPATPTTKKD